MTTRRLIGVVTSAVLTLLRLLWRLRLLVVVVLLALLLQYMYCRPTTIEPCPDPPWCVGSASSH